jgi:hypothetical protein
MIDVGHGRKIRSDCVVWFCIEHRSYANGSTTHLNIKLTDGSSMRVEHGYGVDVYEIERRIAEAVEC